MYAVAGLRCDPLDSSSHRIVVGNITRYHFCLLLAMMVGTARDYAVTRRLSIALLRVVL